MNNGMMIRLCKPFEAHEHAVRRHIFSQQTQYQYVEIVDTFHYGRVLLLDGALQSSQMDEFIYHEAIVHPALCSHPEPQNVLIIGGGEGAVLREVLKYATVQKVTMVDIDRELVDICRQYLPDWHQGAFDDPRVHMVYEDGRRYLQMNVERFDCIILDLSDPFEGSPATRLFTLEFYELVQQALGEGGVLALQAECAALKYEGEHCKIIQTLRQVFPAVLPYYTHIPLFVTLFAFAICGGPALTLEQVTSQEIDHLLESRGVHGLRFYDSQTACGLFGTPKYIRERLEDERDQTITDASPLQMEI